MTTHLSISRNLHILLSLIVLTFSTILHAETSSLSLDTLPGKFSGRLPMRIGIEAAPAYVIPTNTFVTGENIMNHPVRATFATTMRGDFSFNPQSAAGRLYPGLYQGIGLDVRTLFSPALLGTPVSLYIMQGAPFKHLSDRLWLGYEWRFGAAMGWADRSDDYYGHFFLNTAITTRVTAHMGVSLKLYYQLADRWQLSAGIDATHFSNGNTSFPNSGLNTAGLSLGVAYLINKTAAPEAPTPEMRQEADKGRWIWDFMAYGAWRKRVVHIEDTEVIRPGTYPVAGIQFGALRKINRFLNAGATLEMQYDRSGGLDPYWLGGSYEHAVFAQPPFHEQLHIGLGGAVEFTMPIFTIGAGVAYDVMHPLGDNPFYQELTIKAFVTRHLYLNIGYRLSGFKDPQNLMLGLGYRL